VLNQNTIIVRNQEEVGVGVGKLVVAIVEVTAETEV
jgi:hypothetical protein